MTSSTPHLIVVDVETSGLDPTRHDVLEVAAIDLVTGEDLTFVPTPVSGSWLEEADPDALRINRYFERAVYRDRVDVDTTRDRWRLLAKMLDGNIIAGANPQFDASFVDAAMQHWEIKCRRRHQLRDLATYAAGVLGTDPAEPLSSASILESLGVVNNSPHSAWGDTAATADAFRTLRERHHAAGTVA